MSAESKFDKYLSDWDFREWMQRREKITNCVWLEGALLKSPQEGHLFIAPEPTNSGTFFDLRETDIVEILLTERVESRFERKFKIVRVYLKESALVGILRWVTALEASKSMLRLLEQEPSDGGGCEAPERPRPEPRCAPVSGKRG